MGDRLNVEYKDYVPYDQVVAELVPVFARFKAERQDGETFGDSATAWASRTWPAPRAAGPACLGKGQAP